MRPGVTVRPKRVIVRPRVTVRTRATIMVWVTLRPRVTVMVWLHEAFPRIAVTVRVSVLLRRVLFTAGQ